MNKNLTLVQRENNFFIDSRDVAKLIGKRHWHLMRDIAGYVSILKKANQSKSGLVDFFKAGSYLDAKGELRPNYLLSKMGCELVANKMTGEKGVLFTAAYVAAFNEMEANLRAERASSLKPPLSDCNGVAEIIVKQLKRAGATTKRILGFLERLYQPYGIVILEDGELDNIPQTYTATQIAWICGIYSLYGNPHSQAVSCIINDNLFLNSKHKIAVSESYSNGIAYSYRYDEYALEEVKIWLERYNNPSEIYGICRTYHVVYRKDDVIAA